MQNLIALLVVLYVTLIIVANDVVVGSITFVIVLIMSMSITVVGAKVHC